MTDFVAQLIRLFAVFSTLLFSCDRSDTKSASLSTELVLPDSLSLQQAIATISKDPVLNQDTAALTLFLSGLASEADSIEGRAGLKNNPEGIAKAIIDVVYGSWKIIFDTCDTVPETMFPQLVCKYKRGTCLGTSLVILLFAEKMHCPIFGVLLPGHFFCRFADGTTAFNIEPNKSGYSHPDIYYRGRYNTTNRPWYDLKNLSKRETIGVLCYNTGIVCLNRKRSDRAVAYFAEAVRRLNGFPEAQGNLALAYAQTGWVDSAMAIFERLFTAHPDMPGLAANFGATAIACRMYKKAANIFQKGLLYFPDDSTLLSGFALANKRFRK